MNEFHFVSNEEQELLREAFVPRSFKAGDYLLKAGGTSKELFFINKGIVQIITSNEIGDNVSYCFLRENQFCTILSSFYSGISAAESMQAITPVEVLCIQKNTLEALCAKIFYLQKAFDNAIQKVLLDKLEVRKALSGLDSTAKYLSFLKLLPDVAIQTPLGVIASYLEITPQSLSRIRKNIAKKTTVF